MNTENSKTNDFLQKYVLDLPQRLDLKCSNEHVDLQILPIYYTHKNIIQQYKNNKVKISSPIWNDEFEFPDGFYSVSDIQDYIEYIIKNMKHYQLIVQFIFISTRLIID